MSETNRFNVAQNVKASLAKLSPRRQEVIRPILESPGDFVLLSIRASAERLKTDSAFLLRVIQQLGFKSYADFKKYLHELSLASATSFDRLQESSEKTHTPSGLLEASLSRSIQNLMTLKNTLDLDKVLSAAKRMHAARRVVLVGGDLASTLVEYIEYMLLPLGLTVVAPRGTGRVIHTMRLVNKDDVVLAISFRRGLRSTVEGVKDAKQNGAYCLGITNTSISPLARFCDDYFVVGVEGESLRSSYVAPMAFIDVLISAVAAVRKKHSLKLLSAASEEQKHGYRWYQD